jgi:hypothetical protein
MGTQQSRSGHGRQGSHQQSQQSDHRPQQDRDLQRNKQSDRGQQQQSGGSSRQQSQGGSSSRQQSQGGSSRGQQAQSGANRQPGRPPGVQQSALGGGRDFEHKLENEGREQNRMQDTRRRQMSQQNAPAGQPAQRASGELDALRGGAEYGEGNYAGTRQYDKATKEYTESGRVEQAARAATPKSDAEAREMEAAEAEGKRHSKGEDPALTRGTPSQHTPRPGREEE